MDSPPCCPPGSEPSKPAAALGITVPERGIVQMIDGIKTYITRPSDENMKIKAVIVVFYDIFGFGKSRSHHVYDDIAEQGFLVISPDWFGPELEDSTGWFSSFSNARKFVSKLFRSWASVNQKLIKIKNYLDNTTDFQVKELPKFCLGFCWGGWAVFKALSEGSNGKDEKYFIAGATLHPAPIVATLHGQSIKSLVSDLSASILIMPADNDPASVKENGYVIKELRKTKEFGERCEVMDMKGVVHGFSNRGDLKKTIVKERYEQALGKLASFYDSFL